MESKYNTDSHSKISAGGRLWKKYIRINDVVTHKGVSPLRVIALIIR